MPDAPEPIDPYAGPEFTVADDPEVWTQEELDAEAELAIAYGMADEE